jgi:predicted phage gp36 major capsid-like protein
MANAVPLLEGTDASGGYLVSEHYGSTLQNTLRRESAVMALSRVDRVVGRREKYAIYAGRPTAAFVAEGAAKAATGAEFSELVVNIKKIASVVMYTEELLEDAREDPSVLVGADVEAAFMNLIDAHALGYQAGTAIVGSFDSELTNTTQTDELGTGGDAFAIAVSAAMERIESNGGSPNGIVAASDVRAHLRDARATTYDPTSPVYTQGFNREPDTLYGVPIRYSSNLDGFPAGAGKIAAVVGDFNHAVFALRRDITVRTSNQATIDVSGTLHNLWQQNKTAVLWEMRVGFAAHDINRMFSNITNAS